MAWLLIALVAVGALVAGWRGGRVARLAAAVIVLAWLFTAALIATNQVDVQGWFDCGVRCTSAQKAPAYVAFYAPVMLIVLLLGRLAGHLTRRVNT